MFHNAHFRELPITTAARYLSAPFTMASPTVCTQGMQERGDVTETEVFYLVLRNGSEQQPLWRTAWMFLNTLRNTATA